MRPTINLVYDYNENWIGGTYYVLNLIKALNQLEEADKPHIRVITERKTPFDHIDSIEYPSLERIVFEISPGNTKEFINKFYRRIRHEALFKKRLPRGLGSMYPLNGDYRIPEDSKGMFFWIPDFQDRYLHMYFSELQIMLRRKIINNLIERNCPLVFSSNTSFEDFRKFYPDASNSCTVMRFVSIVSDSFRDRDIDFLRAKFNVRKKYFFCPNQLWKHKNHELVLKALKILKERGDDIQVVFTGKEYDPRNPDYVKKLMGFIENNELSNNARFLGFIDREEQLNLMNSSIAVLQPSRFEGWSTAVEDAKALNKFVLASDIPIHREQATMNCEFFHLEDAHGLASKLKRYSTKEPTVRDNGYAYKVQEFAYQLKSLLIQEEK